MSSEHVLNVTFASIVNLTSNSSSNDTTEDDFNQFILPLWKKLLWTFLFTGMVVVATGGNLIVIWIVLSQKHMRTVTNYFIVNLSIADAMVSTFNVTFNFVYMLNSDWPFGTLYCKISQFVAVLSICASVFTLMPISIDRYISIIHPLRPRIGRRSTLTIAVVIWVLSCVFSVPQVTFFTTFEQEYPNGDFRVIRYSGWPDGPTTERYLE